MSAHAAEPHEIDGVVDVITAAFAHDPLWSGALAGGDPVILPRTVWRLFTLGGARYGTVYVDPDRRTASVWIPPGGTELSDEHWDQLVSAARAALPAERFDALLELLERFDAAHPHDEPHYYLNLLATHPAAAGHGYGMAHLDADLARWDAEGLPTYLESSNPVNDRRYERHGYRRVGEIITVLDGTVVGTYWRPVGG